MLNSSFQSLHTADLPAPHSLSRWNEFASETVAGMDVMPHNPEEYFAHLSRVQVGDIGLTWVETSAVTINVEGGHVGAWSAPAGDAFLFNIQETGTCVGHYCGREIITRPGDIVLLDASLMLPWQITNPEPMSNLTLKFPAERMLGLVKDAEALCGTKFCGTVPKIGLASSMLISIKRAIEAHPEEDWDDAYADLLLDIVGTALAGHSTGNLNLTCRTLRRRACAVVEKRIEDPDLDAGCIATELGTSIRTVQRLFLEIGFTPRRYILERRIAVAAEKIRRGSQRSSITEVAYSLGFNDLSYFARSFRKQMGVSARDYRAGRIKPAN